MTRPVLPGRISARLPRQTPSRILLLALASFVACAAFGCAVALGPGYTVEKQQIDVTYTLQAPNQVAIRATYALKNTGTKPLDALQMILPSADEFSPQNIQIEWRDKTISPEPISGPDENPQPNEISQLKFGEKWEFGETADLAISYSLRIAADESTAATAANRGFFLPNSGWYPTLLPATGLLHTGGEPPARWNLTVTVPEGYRVHASGDEFGKPRSAPKKLSPGEAVFEQRPGITFEPFVITGPYSEQVVQSAAGPVLLWSEHPVPAERAKRIADRVGADVAFFRTEFGAPALGKKQIWIIGCVSAQPGSQTTPPQTRRNCVTAPNSAVVSSDFFDLNAAPKLMETVDIQLAETWLQFPMQQGRYQPQFPLAALPNYAQFALEAANHPDERAAAVQNLLQRTDAVAAPLKTLVTVGESDSEAVRERARLESELFFIALEDRCGAHSVHQGIAYASRVLRGQSWSLADLRSAVEGECGGPVLEGFFRQWMHGRGVPEDFRARYMNAGAATKSP